MSLAGLGAFAEGFAGSFAARKEREERAKDREADEHRLYGMGAVPASYGPAPASSENAGGYGAVPPGGGGQSGGDIFGLIDRHEGGGRYDTLFGHSQGAGGAFAGVDVSKMTLAQLYDFSAPSGAYGQWVKGKVGRVATPMGRHQIVGSTLRRAASAMGLSPDTVFTGGVQDSMASYLARERLAGVGNPAAKRAALRAEWEGFKNVSDGDLDTAIAQFEQNGGQIRQRPMGAYGGAPQ